MSIADFKSTLRKLEYIACVKEVLYRIESHITSRNKQDPMMEIVAEFVFCEKIKEKDSRKAYNQQSSMSLIQEFQLVVVMSEFFSRPGPDATRNAIFLSLFGGAISPGRTSILIKLISTAVSGSLAPLLCAAGTWMQQLGCTSTLSLELVQSLVRDFVTFAKKTSEQFRQLPMIAPRFTANLMTAATELYMNESKGSQLVAPPEILMEVFTEWVTENPALCLAVQEPLSLPSGAIAMPVIAPLAGLIRWCVLAPVCTTSCKLLYSKLHLALLQSLMRIASLKLPTSSPTLNVQQLISILNSLVKHSKKLQVSGSDCEQDDAFQSSLDRFGQIIQVAISSQCLFGSTTHLVQQLQTLPSNKLIDIIIKTNKKS